MYTLGVHDCYALVYPRGRIAGGQDLVGQCTTLPSPHGSLVWTFARCQGFWKNLSQKVQQKTIYSTSDLSAVLFVLSHLAQLHNILLKLQLCKVCADLEGQAHYKNRREIVLVLGKFNLVLFNYDLELLFCHCFCLTCFFDIYS